MNKKILFITGTRADFGKLKPLMHECGSRFDTHIFVTGMHMLAKYGSTYKEVYKSGFKNIYQFVNQNVDDKMDAILAKTIIGLSDFVTELKPDVIFVHGDRVEALASAIVGSLNNIKVAHIEGGEVSGTIDEHIRHSVSKLAHIHFVCNEQAKKRLIQLGELEQYIFPIGSSDLDVMISDSLPTLEAVKSWYNIEFEEFGIVLFHPVTTAVDTLQDETNILINSLKKSGKQYVVIYPNNDHGSHFILSAYDELKNNKNFIVIPSMRFEFFLTLLKYSHFMIGNSSAGVREAPFYQVPSINIGTRQHSRAQSKSILNVTMNEDEIIKSIKRINKGDIPIEPNDEFGDGRSVEKFLEEITKESFWQIPVQKIFNDI